MRNRPPLVTYHSPFSQRISPAASASPDSRVNFFNAKDWRVQAHRAKETSRAWCFAVLATRFLEAWFLAFAPRAPFNVKHCLAMYSIPASIVKRLYLISFDQRSRIQSSHANQE